MAKAFLAKCPCGHEFVARAAQAGSVVSCPACEAPVCLPALSKIHFNRWIRPVGQSGLSPFQYRIQHMLVLTAILSIVLAVVCNVPLRIVVSTFAANVTLAIAFLIPYVLLRGLRTVIGSMYDQRDAREANYRKHN